MRLRLHLAPDWRVSYFLGRLRYDDAGANLLANDADAGNFAQTARDAAANYRRGFPTAEECFFNELMEGARYTITCGPARGIVTTVRPR